MRPSPLTLRHALRVLDRKLEPATITAIRSGDLEPTDMHFGLGSALRGTWGLWSGKSALARWFRVRKIYHPEDMSGVVLEAYARHVRGEPLAVPALLKRVREGEREQEALYATELAEGPRRAARLEKLRAGWVYEDHEVQTIALPRHQVDTLLVKIERVGPGFVLFTGGGEREGQWYADAYQLTDPATSLRPAARASCPQVHDVVTLAGRTTWLCRSADAWSLLADSDDSSKSIPIDADALRLGTSAGELFLFDRHSLYFRAGDGWRPVHVFGPGAAGVRTTTFGHEKALTALPFGGDTPRGLGSRLYFPSVAASDAHVLDLSDPPELHSFYWTWGREQFGSQALYVHDLAPAVAGGLWIAMSDYEDLENLVRLHEPATAQVPIVKSSVDGPLVADHGNVNAPERSESTRARLIPATAVFDDGEALWLAGMHGIAVVRQGRLAPVVRFVVPDPRVYESVPHRLARFPDGSLLVGLRGYAPVLLRPDGDGGFTARALAYGDDSLQ
ncbi:DUF6794 domain-containing protein [Nannocystis bainbridge]|nr:DUF6794 domain-containing protein [Nannocystis bainbridge]